MEWSRRVAPSMARRSSQRAVRSAAARQHARTRDVQTRDARDARCRRQTRRVSIGQPPLSMRRLKRIRTCPCRRGHRPMRSSTAHVHPSVRSTSPGLLRSPRPMRWLRSIRLTRVRSTRAVRLPSTRLSRLRSTRAIPRPRTRAIPRPNTSPVPLRSTRVMRSPSTSLGLPLRPPATQGHRPSARTTAQESTTGRGKPFPALPPTSRQNPFAPAVTLAL